MDAPRAGTAHGQRSRLRVILRSLLLAGISSCALTADADLYTTIDPLLCTTILAQLRSTLGQAPPGDPRLVSAEMAYVDLALAGDPRDCGGRGGVWRARARELRDLRRAAGALPEGFAAAIPDLWVDALDGATASCLAALDRYPQAAGEPHARALRCWATGDWRALRALGAASVHERLALAVAYQRSHMGQAMERLERTGLPPFAVAVMQNATSLYSEEGTFAVMTQALRMIPAITASPLLPAAADEWVGDFRRALGMSRTPPPAERAPVLLAALEHAPNLFYGPIINAAWRIADCATAGPGGLRDQHGGWLLLGLGDWATAARLDLFIARWNRFDFAGNLWGEVGILDSIIEPVLDDPGIYGASQRLHASWHKDAQAGHQVLEAIDAELARPGGGLPPARLIAFAAEVGSRLTKLAEESRTTVAHVVEAQKTAEPGRAAGWEEVGSYAQRAGLGDRIAKELQAAAAADPWSPVLERLAAGNPVAGSAPAPARADQDALLAAQIQRLPWRLDLKAQRFGQLFVQKRFDDAQRIAAEILKEDPGNDEVGRRHGACLRELGRPAEAVTAWRAYLAASDAFDRPLVQADIGGALEGLGDLPGATREFTAAAQSGRAKLMHACADFLRRHQRGAEALVWVEREMERYGPDDLDLFAATCMLAGAPKPEVVDAAITRAFAHRGMMPRSGYTWGLMVEFRRLGLHDRILRQIDPSWRAAANAMGVRVALLLLECGHPADAAGWFAAAATPKILTDDYLGYVQALQTLAARLAKRADLAVPVATLRGRIGHPSALKSADPLLRCLVGDIDRAAALTASGKDADELRYYLGLDAMAAGDTATARSYWQAVAAHLDWDDAGGARRLLAWLDAGAPLLDAKVPSAADF